MSKGFSYGEKALPVKAHGPLCTNVKSQYAKSFYFKYLLKYIIMKKVVSPLGKKSLCSVPFRSVPFRFLQQAPTDSR